MADGIPPLVHVQRSWKQQKLCLIELSQDWTLETEQKNLYVLQGCWRPIWNRELTFVCETIRTLCSILPMCAWSCSSHVLHIIKGRWSTELIFAPWDHSSSQSFSLYGVNYTHWHSLEKIELASMRLLLLHCIFLESQQGNRTPCSTYIQQCLKKCSTEKKNEDLLSQKIFCRPCLFYYFQQLSSNQKYSFTD